MGLTSVDQLAEQPSPRALAARVNRTYAGPITWQDVDHRPADTISVDLFVDPDAVLLRYPVGHVPPEGGLNCASRLIVPITATFRIAGRTTATEGWHNTSDKVLGLVAPLGADLCAGFADEDADGYGVKMEIEISGAAVQGRIEIAKRGVEFRRAAYFTAD